MAIGISALVLLVSSAVAASSFCKEYNKCKIGNSSRKTKSKFILPFLILIGIATSLLFYSSSVQAQETLKITEFTVPTNKSYPENILPGHDGNLWFGYGVVNKIGRITPSGNITEFSIPNTGNTAWAPYMTSGPDGNIWFSDVGTNQIGKITPGGIITEYQLPNYCAFGFCNEPHAITTGPDGNIWFIFSTVSNGQLIYKITPDGTFTYLFPIPRSINNGITAITTGSDGNLWFAAYFDSKIGKITPNGTSTVYGLSGGPGAIITGTDDNIWFVMNNKSGGSIGIKIVKITTSSTITEYPISGYGLIINGPDGNIWFAEYSNNTLGIGEITPTGPIRKFLIPAIPLPYSMALGSDGNIWFTESSDNKIVRVNLPGITPPPVPTFDISGFKINGTDNNGTGMENWNIMLMNDTGVQIASAVTDGTGFYNFTGIANGTYNVTEGMMMGWTNSSISPMSQIVTIDGGGATNVNFTNMLITPASVATFNISGFKTNNANGSGVQGWNITLMNSTMQKSMLTGADGSYKFTNLVNGTYNVTEEMQTGWTNVSPISQQVTINGADMPNINFTNKPLTPTQREKFVYVALGDSYQSGEGAGNSILNTYDYLTKAYENGTNYPQSVGPQSNTYNGNIIPNTPEGDTCHRALDNYAKLIRDELKPDAEVVLIDLTCSGATIEKGNSILKTIVGTGTLDSASQVATALNRLHEVGLSSNDVDLITVGMGGNDAKFQDIITATLLPNIVRQLFQRYGSEDWLANLLATPEITDAFLFKTGDAINALPNKETGAQNILLATFSNARILQANYPDILPTKQKAPSLCGGIRKEDLDFVHKKAAQIDKIVADTVRANAVNNPRLELVDLQHAFGNNPLCPDKAEYALANSINQKNLETELNRLLDTNGNGDKEAHARLDQIMFDYKDLKLCVGTTFPNNPLLTVLCKPQSDKLLADGNTLLGYLNDNLHTIRANLAAQPGTADTDSESRDIDIRFDRSSGLFHPNLKGHEIQSCNIQAIYNGVDTTACLLSFLPLNDIVDNKPLSNAPIDSKPGTKIPIRIGGFGFNIPILMKFFSIPIDLGTVMSDSNGVVDTVVILPDAEAGVHTIALQGQTPGEAVLYKQFRVNYSGRPRGDGSYATYLCGFTPNIDFNEKPEHIDIVFLDDVFETLTPDEGGCVFVELPLFNLLNQPDPLTIIGKSQTTGKTVSTKIDPIPSSIGLWAISTKPGALAITGNNITTNGRVHSNADIIIRGSKTSLSAGIEYATTLTVTGSKHNLPSARKVTAGDLPSTWQIADYRPGGSRANSAGINYHAIPETACTNGVWNVSATDVPKGIVYIPCKVVITGAKATIKAAIFAEGSIKISGDGLTITPELLNVPAILTGANGSNALRIDGANIRINGTAQSLSGEARITGAKGIYHCGIISQTIVITGSDNSIPVDNRCRIQ